MLEPYAHYAVAARNPRGSCLRGTDSVEVGRCQWSDSLRRSTGAGRDEDGAEYRHVFQLCLLLRVNFSSEPSATGRTRLYDAGNLEAFSGRNDCQHGWASHGERADRTGTNIRQFVISVSGRPVGRGISGQHAIIRFEGCGTRNAFSRGHGAQQFRRACSTVRPGDIPRATGIGCSTAHRSFVTSATETPAACRQQGAYLATNLRCTESGCAQHADRSCDQSTCGHQAHGQAVDVQVGQVALRRLHCSPAAEMVAECGRPRLERG
jgi:hypothetical protein